MQWILILARRRECNIRSTSRKKYISFYQTVSNGLNYRMPRRLTRCSLYFLWLIYNIRFQIISIQVTLLLKGISKEKVRVPKTVGKSEVAAHRSVIN